MPKNKILGTYPHLRAKKDTQRRSHNLPQMVPNAPKRFEGEGMPNNPKVQIPPKSNPRGHLKPKNESDGAKSRKKTILGGWVPRRARQKDPKVDLQTGPRAPKSKIYTPHQKNNNGGVSLEATEAAFGG